MRKKQHGARAEGLLVIGLPERKPEVPVVIDNRGENPMFIGGLMKLKNSCANQHGGSMLR